MNKQRLVDEILCSTVTEQCGYHALLVLSRNSGILIEFEAEDEEEGVMVRAKVRVKARE